MPAMSPTMTEGGIAQWKKKEGETFAAGDVLLEIVCTPPHSRHQSDPTSNYPRKRTKPQSTWRRRRMASWQKFWCIHSVFLLIHRPSCVSRVSGQDGAKNVQVGSTIAIVAEPGDDLSGADKLAAESSSAPAEKPAEKAPEPPKPDAAPKSEPKAPQPKEESKSELPQGERIFASPLAKKIALERGIPLAKIKGSGPEGRILREDVEKYQPAAAAATAAAAGSPAPAAPSPDYIDIPVSNIRRVIGTRLTQSKQDVPHYYLTVDINMDKVLKLREVFNKTLGEKDKAAKLSVNDFVLKAVACALADVPEANSAWLGETIRQCDIHFHWIFRIFLTSWLAGTRRLISQWP